MQYVTLHYCSPFPSAWLLMSFNHLYGINFSGWHYSSVSVAQATGQLTSAHTPQRNTFYDLSSSLRAIILRRHQLRLSLLIQWWLGKSISIKWSYHLNIQIRLLTFLVRSFISSFADDSQFRVNDSHSLCGEKIYQVSCQRTLQWRIDSKQVSRAALLCFCSVTESFYLQ